MSNILGDIDPRSDKTANTMGGHFEVQNQRQQRVIRYLGAALYHLASRSQLRRLGHSETMEPPWVLHAERERLKIHIRLQDREDWTFDAVIQIRNIANYTI